MSSLSSMKSLEVLGVKETTEHSIYIMTVECPRVVSCRGLVRRDGADWDTNSLWEAAHCCKQIGRWFSVSSNNPHAFRSAQVGHTDAKRWCDVVAQTKRD